MSSTIITVDNIFCKAENLPIEAIRVITEKLTFVVPNYFWIKKNSRNPYWDGKVKFFTRPKNIFNTGLLPIVIKTLEDMNVSYILSDNRSNINVSSNYNANTYNLNKFQLRDYQVKALRRVLNNKIGETPFVRGILDIATNGGKTIIAEAVINELLKVIPNGVILFATHSLEIAYQVMKRFENDLGIKSGFIGDNKWDVRPVSIALIPTLYSRINKQEFKSLVKSTKAFIVDEVHHSSSDSWYTVLNKFTEANVRLGLSGTIDPSNEIPYHKLQSITGEVLVKISNRFLIERGYSAKPICNYITIDKPNLDGVPYQRAYEQGIIRNKERNRIISKITCREVDQGKVVLILVEYENHGKMIKKLITTQNPDLRVVFSHGSMNAEFRNTSLDNLRNNKIDVFIATSILDEGVDVENINVLIYARGMESPRKLLQGIGRGLRKKKDDSVLLFYDFLDMSCRYLIKHSLSRYKTIKSQGFEVKEIDVSSI